MYKKIVSKGKPEYCYLHIRLDFENDGPEISALNFKQIVLEAVTGLFGLTGASSLLDILKYEETDRSAVIRIYHRFLTQLWSSLSLYGNYKGVPCAFRVLQVSPHLMALSCNSRNLAVHTYKTE